MEQLEQIERELEDKPGSDRVSIDAQKSLTHSPQSMSGFTNQAAADLGEDIDISNMRHNFTTLEEARAVTHQTNEYGRKSGGPFSANRSKNRRWTWDQYQRIDSNAAKSAVQAPYVGKSNITYRFEGGVPLQHRTDPGAYLHVYVGGLVVVDIQVNRLGKWSLPR